METREVLTAGRKGQAAIEYLMNYAWAIALIIIVGIAIFGLNIGGIRNALTGQASQLGQAGEQLAIIGHTCGGTTFTLSVQNNGATKLDLKSGWFVQSIAGSAGGGSCNPSSSTLFQGETATCSTTLSSCGTVGQPYKVWVLLNYTDTQNNINFKPNRTIQGTTQAA